MTGPRAFVRPVPDSYVDATRGMIDDGQQPIDVDLARAQHAAYVAALVRCGAAVQVLDAHPSPDSPFVEDTAVIAAGRAVLLRSAHPGRRGEEVEVGRALARAGLQVVSLPAGHCDGGDVLQVGDQVFVGRSSRTDEAGIAALREALSPVGRAVTAVDLPPGVLHLECVCTSPLPGVLVVAEGTVEPARFGELRVVRVPAEESYAANAVGVGGRVLIADGYPGTLEAFGAAGIPVVPLDVSEFRKGDGSLTCLSLLW